MIAKQPRRICFVVTGLCRGGAETQLFHIATGLRARGFDVQVVVILSPDYFGPQLETRGVPVTYLNASRTTSAWRILVRFVKLLRDLRPAALIGFNYPGVMLARAAGAVTNVPVVISSVHTVNHGTRLRRLALAWTDSWATMTTAVSEPVARTLVDLGVPSDRVQVIPNGVDVDAMGPHLRTERRAVRRSLGVKDHEFFWLAAGRLELPKDYPNLLAAMSLVAARGAAVKLAIAGQGPLLDVLKAKTSELGLDGVVSFLGVRGDLPSCMAAADATVLASAWEGLPLVLIESLAVETPVVCTDVGGAREIVTHGGSGFVVPSQNPAALADAMSTLMACSENRRREMGRAGRNHVETHYAIEPVLTQWSDLLDDALDVRGSRSVA
jgi:glycosyltransferase involved in cell wall biosynthesis